MKRVSTVDVLTLLREFKTEKKPIKLKETFLYFSSNKFPLNTETGFSQSHVYFDKINDNIIIAWKSKITGKRYDLGSLWLCLEHHEKQSTTAQYFQDVDRLKLTLVSNVDKEEIINYFTGKIEFTEAINLELRQILLFSFENIFF